MLKRRTPLNKGQKRLKRTALSSRSKKYKEKQAERDVLREADQMFYEGIWNSRPHFCFESGAYLGEEPASYMFHHVLEKSKYPQFRHCDWNIVVLSWEKHNQVHNNIDKTPRVKFLREQLLKKHVYHE
jgi:5-methylcytosine-specific restriction endonuclease McrA